MSQLLLEAKQVAFSAQQREILQSISLQLHADQIVTLIGPNGAGKSTLIKILLGLLQPSAGKVIHHQPLRIGYMPQKLELNALMPISVERFLRLGRGAHQPIDAVLDEVGIRHLLKHPLQNVSGGELQRVLLARALLREPNLLVLDEPVQGVDISGQTELYELIGSLRERYHCGVLMVSHDLHLVMAETDQVICLNQHICCQGHPEQVSNDPAYISLFGSRHAESIALYHHHHDHRHNMHGDVVAKGCNHDA